MTIDKLARVTSKNTATNSGAGRRAAEALTLLAVPADIEPPELARLLDFAERPRTQDWSLRAALVRYAQPRPQSVSDLLDLVRRLEAALAATRGGHPARR